MSVIYHERPGVYSDFDASSVTATGSGTKIVAVIGISEADGGVYTVTSYNDATTTFGADSQLAAMMQLAFANGASTVMAYPVEEDDQDLYTAAATAILATKLASYMVLGTADGDIQKAVLTLVESASSQKGECIAFVGMEEPTVAELVARAATLNSPRMVLVGADVYGSGDEPLGGYMAAAAVAGYLTTQTDPAVPLNGQTLSGFVGVTLQPTDAEYDILCQGGVTALELSDGSVRVIRGITTATTAGGVADTTYRELTTMLIIDEVIPAIRTSLQSKFQRAKNNATTRSAIASQVVVELESRVTREIIDSYSDLTVEADTTDPTTCVVEFSMAVTHGLNRIYLTAHITV
ncbi:MAG: phage tail sheath C-terminal domain-containing protein [Eubacteriales bacterium]